MPPSEGGMPAVPPTEGKISPCEIAWADRKGGGGNASHVVKKLEGTSSPDSRIKWHKYPVTFPNFSVFWG